MGRAEVVKSILNKDPSIGFRTDKKGQTTFHMAVKGTNVDVVLELLKPDPSIINFEDSKGNTALHIAARKGRPEVCTCYDDILVYTCFLFKKHKTSPKVVKFWAVTYI